MRERVLLILTLIIAVCFGAYLYTPKRIPLRRAECQANDQDQYVFSPERLIELSPCIRVAGTVKSVAPGVEDGDGFIDLAVDPPYTYTTNWMNNVNTHGFLHMETICYVTPRPDEKAPSETCARDPDPYRGELPEEGQQIWAEGRWVLDIAHGGHAELHPLYRWGVLK